MKLTPETLMVQPIDAEKVAKLITESLPPLPENETYHVSPYDAFILGIGCLVDMDCCYGFLKDQGSMFIDGKIQSVMVFDVEKRTHYTQENGLPGYKGQHNVCLFNVGVETQLPSLVKDPVPLKEFMGRRFEYNPRVSTNTRKFIADMEQRLG
jgi:hypothetical protein